MDMEAKPPWATITTGQHKPYGGPGQLTRAEFLYLFGEQWGLEHARRTVKSWAEWEAFLAKWDAERSQQAALNEENQNRINREYHNRKKPMRDPRQPMWTGGASA